MGCNGDTTCFRGAAFIDLKNILILASKDVKTIKMNLIKQKPKKNRDQ